MSEKHNEENPFAKINYQGTPVPAFLLKESRERERDIYIIGYKFYEKNKDDWHKFVRERSDLGTRRQALAFLTKELGEPPIEEGVDLDERKNDLDCFFSGIDVAFTNSKQDLGMQDFRYEKRTHEGKLDRVLKKMRESEQYVPDDARIKDDDEEADSDPARFS